MRTRSKSDFSWACANCSTYCGSTIGPEAAWISEPCEVLIRPQISMGNAVLLIESWTGPS